MNGNQVMRKSLSKQQSNILAFIRKYVADYGFVPTFREIGEGCNLSSSSAVAYQIQQLQAKGRITRVEGAQRAITVID